MTQVALDEVMLREPRLLVPRLQPLGRVKVDTAHSLAKDCAFVWAGGLATIDGKYRGTLSAGSSITNADAIGRPLTGTATATEKPLNFGTQSPLTVDTGPFTIVLFAKAEANATVAEYLFSQRLGSGAYNQVTITANSNATPAAASGYINFQTYATSYSNVAVAGAIDGTPKVYGFRRAGTIHTVWINGAQAASADLTARDITAASQGLCLGAAALFDGNAMKTTSAIWLAVAWNRALSDAEMALVGKDPFVFLVPT